MTPPASPYPRLGRYELISLLARGGMAEVFLARVTGAGGFARQLVIKRILPQLVEDPEFIAMFLDEARIAARLTHPNVCQVYELGEVDGSWFLAMEYLEGLTWAELSPLVRRDGAFELACAACVLGQICQALRYAHELCAPDGTPTPVVHRDVSPQNLMVTRDGACKLLDFGVSKVLTEGSRTRTGMLKGKLPYMAPEQIRGEQVDARADVFSLGVVLWEALTGERLFRRDSDYQIWRAVTEEDIPSVRSRAPRLPAGVDRVVGRALERDRERRYPSVAEFAAALGDVAAAVNGPLTAPALADVVQTLGAAQLARRAAVVLAAQRPSVPRLLAAHAAAGGPRFTARGMSATRSLKLRSGLVAIGAHARRRWRSATAVATLIIGAAGGFAAVHTLSALPVSTMSESIAPASGDPTLPRVTGAPPVMPTPSSASNAAELAPITSERPAAVTSEGGPAAVTSEGEPAAVTSEGPAVVTSEGGPAAVTSESGRTRATPEGGPAVVTSEGGPAALTSERPAAVTSEGGPAAVTSESGRVGATPEGGPAAVTSESASVKVTSEGGPRASSSATARSERSAERSTLPAGDRRRRPRPRTALAALAEVAALPGHYSVDSQPYATIFIDGVSYGETPLFKITLSPGKHQVRAVRADGRVRRLTIAIEAGKLTSSGTLTW